MKQRPTIISAGYFWDGIAQKAVSHRAVLIEDGVIKAIGTTEELQEIDGANLLDFSEGTILPGLVDSHTHLSMDASLDNFLDHMSDSLPELTLRATAMMRRDLASGVTTCRCVGDREFLDVACRQAVDAGAVSGPRLLVATRGIRAPEGHGYVGYPFKGVDAIRAAIRENISCGTDLIKIYITGTLKGTGSLPPYLTRHEIEVAVREAHDAGKRVASHCVGGIGMDWAIELGLDTLEHAYHITQAQVDQLARSRTSLVLTPGAELIDDRVRKLPAASIEGHQHERRQMFDSMALAVHSGMPFGVGTDGMHGHLAEDILCLSGLGATNLQALQAATINGARVCGLENETGSLEIGKRADIVIVAGNPLEDLGALKNITAVLSKGDIVHLASGAKHLNLDYAYSSK